MSELRTIQGRRRRRGKGGGAGPVGATRNRCPGWPPVSSRPFPARDRGTVGRRTLPGRPCSSIMPVPPPGPVVEGGLCLEQQCYCHEAAQGQTRAEGGVGHQ